MPRVFPKSLAHRFFPHADPRVRVLLAACVGLALFPSCYDGADDGDGGDSGLDPLTTGDSGHGTDGDGGSSGPSSSSGGSGSGSTSSGSGGGSDGGDETGEPPDPETGTRAGAIRIVSIDANQGVSIPIVEDGAFLDPGGRNAPLIAERAMLVRITDYTLDDGFQPRTLEGRLTVAGGGATRVYRDERMIDGPPDPTILDGTFHWLVDADDVREDTAFHVGIFEPEGTTSTVGDDSGSRWPAGDDQALGVWGDRMVIDLVVVPYCYTPTDEERSNFEAYIYNVYPASTLNVTWHATESGYCGDDSYELAENVLPQLRAQEGAAPNVYYGGLIGPPGTGCGGYSVAISESRSMSFRRTFASCNWRDWGLTADLFAHELGHNHGRDHAFEDPQYPYDVDGSCAGRGGRGGWGFGVRSGLGPQSGVGNDVDLGYPWLDMQERLVPPSTPGSPCNGDNTIGDEDYNDIMSYAYPFWVSDHTYAALAEEVKVISSWSSSRVVQTDGYTLSLTVRPDGGQDWIVHRGAQPVQPSEQVGVARCWEGDRKVAQTAVRFARGWKDELGSDGQFTALPYDVYDAPLPSSPTGDRCVIEARGQIFDVDPVSVQRITAP